jgi:hypothetical protein
MESLDGIPPKEHRDGVVQYQSPGERHPVRDKFILGPQAESFTIRQPAMMPYHSATQLGQPGKTLQKRSQNRQQTIQLFQDDQEATDKGTEFRTLSDQEFALNAEITNLVQTFQADPTAQNHLTMMGEIDTRHATIRGLHAQLVTIVNQYEAAPGGQQTAFFNAYLSDKPAAFGGGAHANHGDGNLNHAQIRTLFDSLAAKTVALDLGDDEHPDVLNTERSRFLMFVMQGLHDSIGVDQYRNLNRNLERDALDPANRLGRARRIMIGRIGPNNLSGGLQDFATDDARSRKTDNGAIAADALHLTNSDQSGTAFLANKFGAGYARTASGTQNQIGDVQVNMDRDNMLLPIFTGMQGGHMRLFSAPKKMTVHHEIGHVNSMLEGRSGGGQLLTGVLGNLTDQEEMYNIWGGPRSDRAYGAELGLPARFDHRSMVAYYGAGGGDHADFTGAIESGTNFVATLTDIQNQVLAQIRRIVDSNWAPHTKGIWRAPDGVKAIRRLFTPGPANLVAVQQAGDAAHNRAGGKNRKEKATAFYQILHDLDPANKINLIAQHKKLAAMQI